MSRASVPRATLPALRTPDSCPCPRHRLRRSCVDLVLRPGVSCVPTCASSRRARRSGNTALSSCPQTYGANTPITILKFTGSGNYSITRPTTTDDPRTYALIHKQYTAAPCAPPLDRRTLQGGSAQHAYSSYITAGASSRHAWSNVLRRASIPPTHRTWPTSFTNTGRPSPLRAAVYQCAGSRPLPGPNEPSSTPRPSG